MCVPNYMYMYYLFAFDSLFCHWDCIFLLSYHYNTMYMIVIFLTQEVMA